MIVFPENSWTTAKPSEVGVRADSLEKAMQCMDEFTLEQGISQAMIIRDGKVIFAGDDIDNIHPVWSCSKSFTSICLGLMIDDGKCQLDDPICKHLPMASEKYPTETIRQFAAFTAGYHPKGYTDSKNDLEFDNPFFFDDAIYSPGEKFHYSMATDVLGYMITLLAGQSMYELFKTRIADHIGMDPRMWKWGNWDECGKADGMTINGGSGCFAKGIWINARQMARVGYLACNYGNWNSKQLLSESYLREAVTAQSEPTTPPHDPEGWYLRLPGSYGLNWWVNGQTHNGKLQWPSAPKDTFALQGNNNNICLVVPSWRMVIVRLGTDGIINTDKYDQVFKLLGSGLDK